ncbi:MAG: hypothetical protein ACW99U_17135 [Candidatus Thorarchaeota archaeon]|jgi:ribosomal protein S27E
MTVKKNTVKRQGTDVDVPASFGEWFACPRCKGRSIVFSKRSGRYSCRRCGMDFLVEWEQMICYAVPVTETKT